MRFHETGGAEVLKLEDLPLTEPGEGEVRLKVDPETIRSDIVTVYRHAVRHPRLDRRRLVVFAHSEGVIHASRLLSERKISATAVVLMGMPLARLKPLGWLALLAPIGGVTRKIKCLPESMALAFPVKKSLTIT